MKKIKSIKCFDSDVDFWEHDSKSTKTKMRFSSFAPNKEVKSCIIWLSGLSCNEENFMIKANSQKILSKTNTMIICPDTSPRGLNLPGEHDSWDFGSAASFYVDASTENYKNNYLMFSYINDELYQLVKSFFSVTKISIFGHSMGGHGALISALKRPDQYQSVSAFAPIANPVNCPWGQKAFRGYLGDDKNLWHQYDSCSLINQGKIFKDTILIDQGTTDEFLHEQLLVENFESCCKQNHQSLKVNYREGYDHSYYFISTFIEDHIKFHQERLS